MDDHEMNIFWKKIVNTINDGLMLIGPEGSILMVNKAFETLIGYTSKEAIGMSCEMLGCDACEKIMQTDKETAWCKLFEGRQDMKKCRCLVKCKDGSFLPVLKNASILYDEDQTALGVVETLTDISELTKLDEKVHILSRQCDQKNDFLGLVGKSSEMQIVFDMVRKAAQSNAPVIILGESGTGKELVANAIHLCGSRKNGPFIQLNCAALNEAVLESELFGHTKGAFTGAYGNRIGRFEAANHGDFFLDEIGDIPLSIQTKLLRVLESGCFERVGDISSIKTDVRIITATNKDLDELIEKKEFRQDLFFRINVIPIHLPPLRDIKEDIPLLINSFIYRLNMTTGKTINGLSHDAMELFMDYLWPGNIRELKNAMEYAFVTTEGSTIHLEHLPKKISTAIPPSPVLQLTEDKILPNEKLLLIQALKQTNGNQTKAAKILNINRVTVWNRMRKYGIDLKKVLSV
ncbi:MAG: sigma 54-interacting transcriptional regulator [Desulfobacula sp.]|uniref:sigma-54 interaction domain-containing protein n=1 Tax=Desulfobacula sp. TaxID=2593537 RepID=UPI0025B9685B|nr:sigma 54-interacting transcriptional regulator [Desulfobacula sp.]MCD4722800.1 sigma 54-interacting transcriptional regulator [Desulfobacula sp.]